MTTARDGGTERAAEVEFSIPSMMCDGCAEKIRHALIAIPGVKDVKAKLWRRRVRVSYVPSTTEAGKLKDALGAAGFPAAEV